MRIIENKFNPRNNQFNTIEEWSKILKNPTDWWKDKGILKTASHSILEGSDRLIDLGRGEKLYNFQQTNGKLLAFPEDNIGLPVKIKNPIYQFHVDKFLKYLSDKNGFHYYNDKLSKNDYVIGCLSIGDKKIIWIYSFDVEGFQKYKTKPYVEELIKEYDFILLSDCVDSSPNFKDNRLGYVSLPFDSQNFEIDFHKFIKRENGIISDKARDYLKDKITFFIDKNLGRIYYKNKLVNIGKGTQIYKFFMFLLQNPIYEHSVVEVVKEKKGVGLSEIVSDKELSDRGRTFKQHIKQKLQGAYSNQKSEINQFLPNIKNGNIKFNCSKKSIFFF